jgi:uncharacterized protein YndB with AHSA1/START domain
MNEATRAAAHELRLERTIPAPCGAVFDAWTNPEVLRRWWAANPGWDSPLAEVDLRVGGGYRLSMRDPETGDVHTVGGEYLEVSPPHRISYTWTWEGSDESAASSGSVVTVDFEEHDGATRVVLVHTGFGDEIEPQKHAHGWNGCLDNLTARVFAVDRTSRS